MTLSKWTISPKGDLCHKGLRHQPRIIYIDDHSCFRDGLLDLCIRPFFKDVDVIEFHNGDEAYLFIKNEIKNNRRLDMIISDINHGGMKGNELAKAIRFYEGMCLHKTRIPIVFVTMVEEKFCPELTRDHIVDAFLSKAANTDEVVECLEELLYSER